MTKIWKIWLFIMYYLFVILFSKTKMFHLCVKNVAVVIVGKP